MNDQIFAQARILCGTLTTQEEALLRLLCDASASCLQARLREGLTPWDCQADFIGAASLYALAALTESDGTGNIEAFTVGDVTVRKSGGTGARCLRSQAELMMAPWLRSGFAFLGV